MSNKKGQGLSINYIVMIAIALVVLVVVVLFFTGAFKTLIPRTQNIVNIDSNTKQIWRNVCETSCPSKNYCEINYKVEDKGGIKEVYICDSKAKKTVEEILTKEELTGVKIKSLNVPCEVEC